MALPDPPMKDSDAAILARVERIARRALGPRPVDVYVHGSWARGAHRASSDIDLAVDAQEPLPPGVLARLRDALEESTIPYRVDVVDLADTDPAFRERVRREGVLWIASPSA